MAGIPISALPAVPSPQLTDIFPVVQGGVTYKESSSQLLSLFKTTGLALTSTSDTNVTITLGGNPSTALLNAASITMGWAGSLAVGRGGTGTTTFTPYAVICAGTTATGAFQNVSGIGSVNQVLVSNGAGALPTWQSVPGVTPAALTKTDDTNVTLTLSGTPATALLQATGIAAGWTGTLSPVRGGTGINNGTNTLTLGGNLTTSGAFASTFTMTGATNVIFPNTGTLATTSSASGIINSGLINQVAYYAASGTTLSGLSTANNGVLVTSSGAVPSISSTLPASLNIPTPNINDANGNAFLRWAAAGSPTTWLIINNSSSAPGISSAGNTNTSLDFSTTGTGAFQFFQTSSSGAFMTFSTAGGTGLASFTFPTSGSPSYTFPSASGTVALTSGASGIVNSGLINQLSWYAASGTTLSGLSTANSAVLVTSSGGVPSLSTTLPNINIGTPSAGVLTNTTGGGGLRSFQIFTSGTGATYTKPAGITSILVEVIGGGGGGGGSAGGASTFAAAGGGGAAGYARLWVASAASSYTYTVGALGAGGTAGANPGSAGGTTTFSASSLQATGGAGGAAATGIIVSVVQLIIGGLGGVGTNGDINSRGAPGDVGLTIQGNLSSGNGGSAMFGGGGLSISGAIGTGNAAGNYGSGGSGGSSTTVSAAGGAGSSGLIIVWEFS